MIIRFFTLLLLLVLTISIFKLNAQPNKFTYNELRSEFLNPDYSYWGEVPLWWWEADSLNEERITWQLEELSSKGVKAVCPIQRSPARSYPDSFSEKWWETVAYVHKECQRLGMRLWLYDQVGYGQYGWLENAAAQVGDTGTSKINFQSFDVDSKKSLSIQISEENIIGVRAYKIENDTARDELTIDLSKHIKNDSLKWHPTEGKWRVAITTLNPYQSFYLNESSADVFLEQLYGRIEKVVGVNAMGKSLIGVFQDEHPPTPRDIYTQELADKFKTDHGYDIARAIPTLYFDVGEKTPKYRIDYFDTYLSIVEKTYWEKVYNWTAERNILTSHDNWGRNNIYRHSEGYIDYFSTQKWFSAPGFDDWGQNSIENRNYYDTKIASSIARLYNRPRVWAEVFHSSGWGRTPNQTLSWLSTLYAFGANLYDEHGLYYSLNASTWEHAAGDPHWRQPYWEYYENISDWVTRMSYIMSQGTAVVDVAVHYPVVSVLSEVEEVERSEIDYNHYMKLSRAIYNKGIDNDIIDDQSILNGTIDDGRLKINGCEYQALVFGPERTVRLPILEKALELVKSGGSVFFYGELPTASAENGKKDTEVTTILKNILNITTLNDNLEKDVLHKFDNGGFSAFIKDNPDFLPTLLSKNIKRDFINKGDDLYYSHRKIEDIHVYLLQNTENKSIQLEASFRVDGIPELWDPFTGKVEKVKNFQSKNGYTQTELTIEGNVAKLLVFKPGSHENAKNKFTVEVSSKKLISENWEFSIIPTCDNQWGDFRWPPSKEKIGVEVRQFKYADENNIRGTELEWNKPSFNDENWENTLYSTGPYWLALENISENFDITTTVLKKQKEIECGDEVVYDGEKYKWENLSYSKKLGLARPSPWGGHSGYPDGHIDKNFIQLKEGRKLLFTRVYSPVKQRVGLNVQLRNTKARLWVNGKEEHFLGTIGNLPLNKGYNYILLDLKDGSGGMLFVQKEPPLSFSESISDSTTPDLSDASWIWTGNTEGAYFRKSFNIESIPQTVHVIVSGVSGFRLFVNGQKVDEDIGPWATWNYPKSVNIKPYLKEGKNVFAAWGQFFKGINVSFTNDYQGFILAMKAVDNNGQVLKIKTDDSWKGSINEFKGWEKIDYNDSNWDYVTVKGKANDKPWGSDFLKNTGGSTTPYRPLSVNLSSPYIEVFDEIPNIVYDVKKEKADRIGWYRFDAPPGIKEIELQNNNVKIWVNGKEIAVKKGVAIVENPPKGVSKIAVRLEMKPGEYAGAAFKQPIKLKLNGGIIQPGLWSDFALPVYSGIGVYKQKVHLSKAEIEQKVELDLGEVYVAAEVFINGNSAGSKISAPYKYDLFGLLHSGENDIEVRVANTLAPHYSIPNMTINLGPVKSGLIGPVLLKISK